MQRPRCTTEAGWHCRSERGAIIIHVGIALLALIAFSSFAVDQGVRMVSRNQAQNGADAGAMAAAIALALDDYSDRSTTGPAVQAGREFARTHAVWGGVPDVQVTDVTFPPCPDDASDACVRVDVYRNQARGNPLPSYFGQVVGVSDQGVRATATAKASIGNASNCLKPWAIQDKWDEQRPLPLASPPFQPTSSYDRYVETGSVPRPLLMTPPPLDTYTPPTTSGPGTGYNIANDVGRTMLLKANDPGNALNPGHFRAVAMPSTATECSSPSGANCYEANIRKCNGVTLKIGDLLTVEPGNMPGPTSSGVDALIALDSSATITTCGLGCQPTVTSGCVPGCGPISPRIVAVPVFDTDLYEVGRASGRLDVRITNILGFFVQSTPNNGEVQGVFMMMPGQLDPGGGGVGNQSAFTFINHLVR